MTSNEKIAAMSDDTVCRCVNDLLKGYGNQAPLFGELIGDNSQLKYGIDQISNQIGIAQLKEENLEENNSLFLRNFLVFVSQDADLNPRLEAWLADARPRLFDPVTTMLVAAGIVYLLSLKTKLQITRHDGESGFNLSIEKDPTSANLIKTVLGIGGAPVHDSTESRQ